MDQMLQAYSLPKETVIAIMMLYRTTKAMVCSSDRNNDFDIVAGVLQDTCAQYLLIICLDKVLLTSVDLIKENGFTVKKKSKM